MLTRKKPKRPHPRSIEALFAKIKRCQRGHSQTPAWRPALGCSTCKKVDDEFAARQIERTYDRQQASTRERISEAAKLPSLPPVYVMVSTRGEAQTFRPGPRRRRR